MYLEALILFITLYFTYVFFAKPKEYPPGTFGYPVIGNLPPSTKTMTEHLREMKNKYGTVFTTKWGSFPVVVMTEFDTIKKIFSTAECSGRARFNSADKFNYSKPGGIILSEGNIWIENRRFMLKNLRDLGMGKTSIEDAIQKEAAMLVKYLSRMDLEEPIEMDWSFNVAVLNVIWHMFTSKRYEPDDAFIIKFTENAAEDLEIIQGPLFLFDIMPWLTKIVPSSLFDKLTRNRQFLDHRTKFKDLSMKMIKEHEATLDVDNPRDVIDSYLIEMKKNQDGQEYTRNYDDLLITMNDMFFAGSETTASTLRWLVLYLAVHPEIQKKVHELLDANVPKDRLPSLEDRPNLQYLDAVILETLRLSSLLKIGLVHKNFTDMEIEGHFVPKGTLLVGALELVNSNPEFWKHPQEFYPEHFLTEDGKLNSKPKGFAPFSIGRRQCLGESLAKMELYIFSSAILQRFTISPPEGVTLDTSTDKNKIMLNTAKPYKVMLKKRI